MNLSEVKARKNTILALKDEIFSVFRKYECTDPEKTKSHNNDFVTLADVMLEKLIKSAILDNFPNDNIEAEEEGRVTGTSDYTWHIDPIDGTHPFTRGIKEYGSSIGLQHKNEIVAGVIFFSEDEKAYWAIKDQGAYCEDKQIYTIERPLKNSAFSTFGKSYCHNLNKVKDEIGPLYTKYACISFFVYLATGKYDAICLDGFTGSTWDICAGAIIAKEAGAKISEGLSELDSSKLLYAATPNIYDDLLELLEN